MENRELTEQILRDYEFKKNAALERKNNEIKKAYEKAPELKEIDEEINRLGFESMRKILADSKNAKELRKEFEKNLSLLSKKRDEIIIKNKIKSDYNKPLYECSLCEDTGFLPDGRRCECFEKMLADAKYKKSQLGKMLDGADFENFSLSYYSGEGKEIALSALNSAKDFCENFDKADYNLFFYGMTGLGKTFLSSIIAKSMLSVGKSVYYARASKMFALYDDYKFRDYSLKDEIDMIYGCDLLVIDDLGSEFITKNSIAFLFDLVNDRLINNKKIIINTNFSINEFSESYTVRLTSRIYESFKIFGFEGEDIRIKKLIDKK